MFRGTVDFDPGIASTPLSVTGNLFSAFVWKLSSSGEFIWVRNILRSTGDGIDLDPDENVCLSGSIYSGAAVDFDPDPVNSTVFTSSSNNDGFALKLSSAGNFIGANRLGGTLFDAGYSIAALNNMQVAIVGSVQRPSSSPTTVTFGSLSKSTIGDHDAFATGWTFPAVCITPAITVQPAASSVICSGTPGSVPVSFSGTLSAYQWYKEGMAVSGQTTATLSLLALFRPMRAAIRWLLRVPVAASPAMLSA